MRARRLQQGGVFIITIGVLAALVAILAAVAATEKVNIDAVGNRMRERRAYNAALSGVQRALAELTDQDQNATTTQDQWALLGGTGAVENFIVGSDSFRIQVVDASSFINLNTASQTQLERLPLTAEQIDSMLDWREAGLQPRTDGAKDEYYNQLATPYNTKLRALDTFDELLLIKNFRPTDIFEPHTDLITTGQTLPAKANGEQPTLYDLVTVASSSKNVGANGTALPRIATVASPFQFVQLGIPQNIAISLFGARGTMTTYAAMLQQAGNVQIARILVNNFTPSATPTSTGKINVNTATEAVLTSLANITPDIASAILARQPTGFTQLGDLFDIPGYSLQIAGQTMDQFTTNSQTFLARVVGKAGDTTVSLETLITLSDNGPQITKVWRPPFANMSTRWGWETATTSDTTLKEATDGR